MNNKDKKYKYTYIVVCTDPTSSLYKHFYYGKHSTNNLNDNYIGSGNQILKYIKKYPGQYYRRILNFYNNEEELNQAEYNLIHPWLNFEYCLNLVEGGSRSNTTIGKKWMVMDNKEETLVDPENIEEYKQNGWVLGRIPFSSGHREKLSKIAKERTGEKNPMYGKEQSQKSKKLIGDKSKQRTGEKNGFYNKHHTKETKKIQSDIKKGEKNPMYGVPSILKNKIRITDGAQNKFIFESEKDLYLNNGWTLGITRKSK